MSQTKTKKQTQLVKDTERLGWEVYQDMAQAMVPMSTPQLLTLAKEALNSIVAMCASDELARRRPQGR